MARPITKKNRSKVGLSLNNESVDILSSLSAMTGKSKSRIVEEAISMFSENQSVIQARIKKIEKLDEKAFLDIDKILEKRLKREGK